MIAKRVVEDRSASVEAPAPAEHCIVVKQASGGGGEHCSACLVAHMKSIYCSPEGAFLTHGHTPDLQLAMIALSLSMLTYLDTAARQDAACA